MVARTILLQERVLALQALEETLSALEGSDPEHVAEISARAGSGQVGADFLTASYLREISRVLADQQRRLEELEAQPQSTKRGTRKSKSKQSE